MKNSRASIFILVGLLILSLSPAILRAESGERRIALVTFRVGDVDLVRKEKTQKLKVREIIEENDVIRTGKNSRVVVQFSEGAFVAIQENSEVSVNQIKHTPTTLEFFLNVVRGRLGVDAQKGAQKYNIQIQGPTAVALVRGTTFMVEAEGQSTRVLVGEGEVEVQGPGAAKLAVRSGEKVLAEPGPNKSVGLEKNMMDEFENQKLQMLEEFRASKARNFDHLIQQIERNKNLMPR